MFCLYAQCMSQSADKIPMFTVRYMWFKSSTSLLGTSSHFSSPLSLRWKQFSHSATHKKNKLFDFSYVTHYSETNLNRTSRTETWNSSEYIDKLRYCEKKGGKYFAWTIYKPTAIIEATPWIQLNWNRAGFFDNSMFQIKQVTSYQFLPLFQIRFIFVWDAFRVMS